MREILDVLKAAKAVIENPANWTKGAYARDRYLTPIDFGSSSARCFCSLGALRKVEPTYELRDAAEEALDQAAQATGQASSIVIFNDVYSHRQVMQVWDAAIKQLEEQAQGLENPPSPS